MPAAIANRIKDNPGIAFVGPGFPNGIETVTSKAIHNPEHIMVNYAEGSIGNIGESRPIAVKFGTAMIPELQKQGYEVNIFPVTSQGSSFMKKDMDPKMLFGRMLDAKVHPPITNAVINFLAQSGQLDKLGILLRATWLSELETNRDASGKGTLIQGALTIQGIEEMSLQYFETSSPAELCELIMSKE
jgi:hypothetical protein